MPPEIEEKEGAKLEAVTESAASNQATIAANAQFSKSELIAKLVSYASTLPKNDLAQVCETITKEGVVPKPVDTGHSKNVASVSGKAIKEDLDVVYEGAELSEEFKTKATTLFEAAVSSRVSIEEARIAEEYENKLTEAVEAEKNLLAEKVEVFMDLLAKQWLEENKVEVTSEIRTELSESFIGALKKVFEEHYITIPEEKVDLVEQLVEKAETLTETANKQLGIIAEANKKIEALEVKLVKGTLSEGLTETQKEKLYSLLEGITYDSVADFEEKAKVVKEAHFKPDTVVTESTLMSESIDPTTVVPETPKQTLDPVMDLYVKALTKSLPV